ncbi:recombinase zinc beta ribbon domain-containing protein [Streptomyces sp. NBC_01255]|uniref:recombinase zinc beta ribbon domain-containing protein n=1 Tax=Streptomyces sp. NBC_01255 TaxID=2903798 RepID=UPI002E37B595|nr:recombinase zinc beta ribbon domain-containing protein [Streptomyces sp. NBC_01255]
MKSDLRYLACLRLSSDSDESTAIARQRRGIEHYVNAPHVAGILVGEAEDTDVSGGLSPFRRPRLGRWLNHRADEIKTRIGGRKQTTHRIAKELNEKGVLTWSDHLRERKGQVPKGVMWQATIINKMVRSNWFPGIYTYKGEAVLGDDGEPFILPDRPHAEMDEWFDLVERIAPKETSAKGPGTRAAKSLLAGIAKCGECGASLARVSTSGAQRKDGTRSPSRYSYRCTNRFRGGSCKKGAYIACEELDRVAEDIVLQSVGQWQQYDRAGAGPSVEKELAAAGARLTRLEGDFLAGKCDGEGQEESYWRMHKSLSGTVRHLKKQQEERRNPHIRPTGRQYGEVWDEKDQDDRRSFLKEYKVTMWVWRDCLPDMARGSRSGAVLDLGEIGRIAAEQKLVMPEPADWIWCGWNVPRHWASPHLLEDPETREALAEAYGSTELPMTLRGRLDAYERERPT